MAGVLATGKSGAMEDEQRAGGWILCAKETICGIRYS